MPRAQLANVRADASLPQVFHAASPLQRAGERGLASAEAYHRQAASRPRFEVGGRAARGVRWLQRAPARSLPPTRLPRKRPDMTQKARTRPAARCGRCEIPDLPGHLASHRPKARPPPPTSTPRPPPRVCPATKLFSPPAAPTRRRLAKNRSSRSGTCAAPAPPQQSLSLFDRRAFSSSVRWRPGLGANRFLNRAALQSPCARRAGTANQSQPAAVRRAGSWLRRTTGPAAC